jgi:hypothetical protein
VTDDRRDALNATRHRPGQRRGHYESWFLRANDPSGRRAFWIRYTLFSPKGRPADAVGELWAIAFDRQTGQVVAVKETRPLDACAFAADRLDVRIGDATLADGAARGSAAGAGGDAIAWDLRYGGGGEPLLLMPARMYRLPLPRAKVLVGQPLARFDGTVTVNGETLAIDGWIGSQNHNWGSRHTSRYAWGQVAGFDEEPDAFLECSTAKLRIGPFWTPWMSMVVLRLRGETLRWNSLPRAIRAKGRYGAGEWTLLTSGRAGTLALSIRAQASEFADLRYDDPPGGVKRCLNSKIARCTLTLRRDGRSIELHSSRAAFEIVDDLTPGA